MAEIYFDGGTALFKPHRFNPLLKAMPNKDHAEKVSQKLVHGRTHEELLKEVDVKKTTTADGKEHITKEVIEETVKTKGLIHKKTEVDATARVIDTTTERNADGEVETVETSEILTHVHATIAGVANVEMTPPHPPREETPQYNRAHHHLIYELDSPCAMCGVRHSTLKEPRENPFGAQALETHHYPIERSLLDACDPKKVGVVFPEVKDQASLENFIDSEHNLMVLCDVHHRHPLHGIHHLVPQDFFVQPFLLHGYQVVSTEKDQAKILAANEKLIAKENQRRAKNTSRK